MLRLQDGRSVRAAQDRRGGSGQTARKYAPEYGQDDSRNGRSQVVDLKTVIGAAKRPFELRFASCSVRE